MRVIITGGAGFIGSHVSDRLLQGGHEVHLVDDLSTGKIGNVPRGATLHRHDIRDSELEALFLRLKPHGVVHLAAQMDVRRSVADPAADAQVNVVGGLNVLESARRSGVSRFVFASTGGALYGEPELLPADESTPVRPLSPYGASKAAFEDYLRLYGDLHGMRSIALRLSNVFGPRQDPHGEAGVVAIFALKCLKGEACTIFGDGTKTRDYVYVSDVVDAFEAALAHDGRGAYNIGRGIEVSDRLVFDTVRKAAGAGAEPIMAPRRPGEVERISLGAAKAKAELGWSPAIGFEDGVERAVAFYRTQSS